MKKALFFVFIIFMALAINNTLYSADHQDTVLKRSGLVVYDSIIGLPGVDYEPDEVMIIIRQDKFDLDDLLGQFWGKRDPFRNVPHNTLLRCLGIDNPVCDYYQGLNLVGVKTKPGQSVVSLIKELKNIWQARQNGS